MNVNWQRKRNQDFTNVRLSEMLNTKIKCTHVYKLVDTKGFKSGEIYEIKDGRLILPNGSKSNIVFETVDQINESFYAYFKEVKEEHL